MIQFFFIFNVCKVLLRFVTAKVP